MLLLLDFLDVKIEYHNYDQVASLELDGSLKRQNIEGNSTDSLITEITTNVSIKTYRDFHEVKSQDVSQIIRVDFESLRENPWRYLQKNSSTKAPWPRPTNDFTELETRNIGNRYPGWGFPKKVDLNWATHFWSNFINQLEALNISRWSNDKANSTDQPYCCHFSSALFYNNFKLIGLNSKASH